MTDQPPFDLPKDVTDANLPEEAQQVYRDAFNDAWTSYGRNPKDETRAHAIAWSEVRKMFPGEDIANWKQESENKKPTAIDPDLQ